jgi:hypothetical protein
MPTISFFITDKCSGIMRTAGVQNSTLEGRLNGKGVTFDTVSYEEYKMRRKAEVLNYGITESKIVSKKQQYTQVVNNGSRRFSQLQITLIANNQQAPISSVACPIISNPASNSGVKGEYKMKYYNNPQITFYPSL